MNGSRRRWWGITAAVLGGVLVVALTGSAEAQPGAGSAEIKGVTGRVEVSRKGEARWMPAAVGARLAEGDDIRAYAGASAELLLPDGSTILLAENSRLVVSKLEFNPQDQTRVAFFHLAVGKARALVSHAAVWLIRSRQSNFVISTPTGVAAARGTIFEVIYDWARDLMTVGVLPRRPQEAPGLVTCTSFYDRFSRVTVREGLASIAKGADACGPPVPIQSLPDADLIGTLRNPLAPGAAFTGPVTVPPFFELPGVASAPPTGFAQDTTDSPSSIGLDILLPASAPATR